MRCPSCGDEYERALETCTTCGVALVDEDAPHAVDTVDAAGAVKDAAPSRSSADHTGARSAGATAVVGRFDPALATAVAEAVRDLGVEPTIEHEDGVCIVAVPSDARDGLRAHLAARYRTVLDRLDDEGFVALEEYRGPLPGWLDAPDGAWVDRAGRLHVAVPDEEEIAADDRRTLGPALVGLGLVLALLGWYAGGDLRAAGLVACVPLVVVGLMLPR